MQQLSLEDDCLSQLVASVSPHAHLLAQNTFAAIETLYSIAVLERPEQRTTGVCAVDGAYFSSPPRIIVAAAVSPRRRAFTALHELAHHLIRHDWALFGLAGYRETEERVCNRFAAEILAPQVLCDEVLGSEPPSATAFADLYLRSAASRAVCARLIAARLPGIGHAVVALGTVVTYCAGRGTPFHAEYGTEQGPSSVFGMAVREGTAHQTTRLIYREGFVSPEYDVEALYSDGHVFAIFTDAPA